jgi:hypothetical protein
METEELTQVSQFEFGHFELIIAHSPLKTHWELFQWGNPIAKGESHSLIKAHNDALSALQRYGEKWGYGV